MTENYTPAYAGTPLEMKKAPTYESELAPTPSGQASGSAEASTADVAKQQASTVAQSTTEAGQHVADVAKDQVASVASDAGSQAKDLLAQARTELATQAGQQQQRLAGSLRALGEELHSMAQHDGQPGMATDLAHQGARRTQDLAAWLDQREPGQLVGEITAFARRKPGTFLLLAVGAGLAAGRLTRGMKDANDDSSSNGMRSDGSRATPTEVSRPFAASQQAPSGFSTTGGLG